MVIISSRSGSIPTRLRGRNLAHGQRGPGELAALGVLWGKGQLVIVEPTVKQIAALFGVSVPTLRAAIREAKALEADAELRAAAWLKPLMRPRRVRNRIDELV